MTKQRSTFWAGMTRLLYNHNPFYLISALLVLYGIYRAMPADSNAGGGWLLLSVLCGYTVVLALAAFVIIRFGQVWNDARTILVSLVLLLVVMSTIFDQIVLDNPAAGARLLLLGLAFAIALSEGVLRGLRLPLAKRYRGPYYLMLGLLFGYPLLLGVLSKVGKGEQVPHFVALFPVIGGIAFLTLFPAARRHDQRQLPAGHPWRWPIYPWSAVVMLLVAMGLRTYSFSHGFESGHLGQSTFQPFFLLPLLFAAALLFLELAKTAKSRTWQTVFLTVPIGMFIVALSGTAPNPVAAQFLQSLSNRVGSPVQLTAIALTIFYCVAWFRGLKLAETGLIVCATVFAAASRQTIDFNTLHAPHWAPLASIGAIEFLAGLRFRTSWRQMLAATYGLGSASRLDWLSAGSNSPHGVIEALGVVVLVAFVLGAVCDDRWARRMRRFGWPLIPLVALAAMWRDTGELSAAQHAIHAVYLACLTTTAFIYWYRTPALTRFAGAAIASALFVAFAASWAYRAMEQSRLAEGLPWMAWGSAALGLAMALSLAKAGIVSSAVVRIARFGKEPKVALPLPPRNGNDPMP